MDNQVINEIPKKKGKKRLIIGIIIVILAVAVIVTVLIYNSLKPSWTFENFKEAIRNEDLSSAENYYDEIKNKYDRMDLLEKAQELSYEQAFDMLEMYANEEIEFSEIDKAFARFQKNILKENLEFKSLMDDLTVIHDSELEFKKAGEAELHGNYILAIDRFANVNEKDNGRYKKAQQGIERCKELLLTNVLTQCEQLRSSHNYNQVQMTVAKTLDYLPNNEKLLEQLELCNNEILANKVEMILNKVDRYVANGNYKKARNYILKESEGDDDVVNALKERLTEIEEAWFDAVKKDVDEDISLGEFENAINRAQELDKALSNENSDSLVLSIKDLYFNTLLVETEALHEEKKDRKALNILKNAAEILGPYEGIEERIALFENFLEPAAVSVDTLTGTWKGYFYNVAGRHECEMTLSADSGRLTELTCVFESEGEIYEFTGEYNASNRIGDFEDGSGSGNLSVSSIEFILSNDNSLIRGWVNDEYGLYVSKEDISHDECLMAVAEKLVDYYTSPSEGISILDIADEAINMHYNRDEFETPSGAKYDTDYFLYNGEFTGSFGMFRGKSASCIVHLNGEYSEFTTTIAPYKQATPNSVSQLRVFFEGILVYESSYVKPENKPFEIKLDVTDVSEMTLEIVMREKGEMTWMMNDQGACLGIMDPIVKKEVY